MLRKSQTGHTGHSSGSGGSHDQDHGGAQHQAHKLEAGVAEINNSLCNAMFGIVLSDEVLRLQIMSLIELYNLHDNYVTLFDMYNVIQRHKM